MLKKPAPSHPTHRLPQRLAAGLWGWALLSLASLGLGGCVLAPVADYTIGTPQVYGTTEVINYPATVSGYSPGYVAYSTYPVYSGLSWGMTGFYVSSASYVALPPLWPWGVTADWPGFWPVYRPTYRPTYRPVYRPLYRPGHGQAQRPGVGGYRPGFSARPPRPPQANRPQVNRPQVSPLQTNRPPLRPHVDQGKRPTEHMAPRSPRQTRSPEPGRRPSSESGQLLRPRPEAERLSRPGPQIERPSRPGPERPALQRPPRAQTPTSGQRNQQSPARTSPQSATRPAHGAARPTYGSPRQDRP